MVTATLTKGEKESKNTPRLLDFSTIYSQPYFFDGQKKKFVAEVTKNLQVSDRQLTIDLADPTKPLEKDYKFIAMTLLRSTVGEQMFKVAWQAREGDLVLVKGIIRAPSNTRPKMKTQPSLEGCLFISIEKAPSIGWPSNSR